MNNSILDSGNPKPPFMTFQLLQSTVGGRWLVEPMDGHEGIRGIYDDSRAVVAGSLFVAIAGELTDGHKYVVGAAERGAGAVVVQMEPDDASLGALQRLKCPVLLVTDSLRAFQLLARWHRFQFPQVRVLAVTGSCGKTSTKEFCAAMLEERFPGAVLKTIGSTNNHFGVPRNLLRIDGHTRVAVIELGSNHPGEIANLVSMVQPDVSLVCSVGHAHLEFFHDLEGVACEKGDIYCGTPVEGVNVVPKQAPHADVLLRKAGLHKVQTFAVDDISASVSGTYLGFKDGNFRVRLHWNDGVSLEGAIAVGGRHAASNAACAACATSALGVTPQQCMAGLARCVLPGERQKIAAIGGITYVNDAFNSNPDSARAALDFFSEIIPSQSQAALLLGDMLELGEKSLELHCQVLAYALARFPLARVAVVGAMMVSAAEAIDGLRVARYPDAASAASGFVSQLPHGSWLLLKSSHGIGLSRVMPE